MSANPRIGSAFRLIGFVFILVAVIPAFRGEGVNFALLVPGITFWIIGLIFGLKARRNSAHNPTQER